MAAISAGFTFTPPLPNGQITAVGNNLTEIKSDLLAKIAARRSQPAADVAACDAATAIVNS
jgi:hypothetical protein